MNLLGQDAYNVWTVWERRCSWRHFSSINLLIEPKTRTDLLARAKTLKMSPMDLVGKIRDGKVAVKPISLKRSLEPLVDSIRVLRKLALEV
jgi:hypothetical protein